MKFLILIALVAGAAASCENGCSGHGHCGLYDSTSVFTFEASFFSA